MNRHEELFARCFITPPKRARYAALLATEKGRTKALNALHHMHDLDNRYARLLTSDEDTAAEILRMLREHGAPAMCYVISADREIDGRELPLDAAIDRIHCTNFGTVISCIPGKLAYLETEDIKFRYILRR